MQPADQSRPRALKITGFSRSNKTPGARSLFKGSATQRVSLFEGDKNKSHFLVACINSQSSKMERFTSWLNMGKYASIRVEVNGVSENIRININSLVHRILESSCEYSSEELEEIEKDLSLS